MKSVLYLSGTPLLLIAMMLLVIVPAVQAQDDVTYEDLLATYGDRTREDVEAAGYIVEPVCVDAAAAGAPAELGGMGFHAVNEEFLMDNEVHTTKPDIILLDDEGEVIGVEYEIDSVVDDPPLVAGQPLIFTPPHPGVEHEHMSLHIYFVGDEAHRFGTWNPAVTCPEGSTPPAVPATLPESGGKLGIDGNGLLFLVLGAGLIGVGLFTFNWTRARHSKERSK